MPFERSVVIQGRSTPVPVRTGVLQVSPPSMDLLTPRCRRPAANPCDRHTQALCHSPNTFASQARCKRSIAAATVTMGQPMETVGVVGGFARKTPGLWMDGKLVFFHVRPRSRETNRRC